MNTITWRDPTESIDRWALADGLRMTLRPVLPQDAELVQAFVRGLSVQSRYQRFFNPIRELSPQMLEALRHLDYRRHLALIAEVFVDGAARAVGEAQYVADVDGAGCEFAVAVADDWRRLGIASRLVDALTESACRAGLRQMHGDVLADNAPMLAMMRKRGYRLRRLIGDAHVVQGSFVLPQPCVKIATGHGAPDIALSL